MSHLERVIVLVDMDCFYCQVEENLNPDLKEKPLAVVQYNAWMGGGIIAVNYPARDRGVTRHMRGNQAKEKCPEIELVSVPSVRGKADLTKYRDAGKKVAEVLQDFTSLLERASVDEAYLDITETVNQRLLKINGKICQEQLKNTFVVGCTTEEFLFNLYNDDLPAESNFKLAVGAIITEEIRAAVFEQTGYECSAGIAHNKILAKLACGVHKPNKQTILPQNSISQFYETLPIQKIKSLGGKFGHTLSEELGIKTVAELMKFSEKELIKLFDEKAGIWLYNIARGINNEPVTARLISKSIGCCKKFPGKTALTDSESINHWLNELSSEIVVRLQKDLEENNRKAKQVIVSFVKEISKKDVASSRTQSLSSYNSQKIAGDAFEIIRRYCMRSDGSFCVKFLGLSAGKFEDCKNLTSITSFFKNEPIKEKNNEITIEPAISPLIKRNECDTINKKQSIKDKMSENFVSFFKVNQPKFRTRYKVIDSKDCDNDENTKIVGSDTDSSSSNMSEQVDTSIATYQNVEQMEIIPSDDGSFSSADICEPKLQLNDYKCSLDAKTDESNVNCYLAATQEDTTVDIKQFYDDVYRVQESNVEGSGQNNIMIISDNDSIDSISNEISNANPKLDEATLEEKQQSFFLKYFQELNEKQTIRRDFNTSRNLIEVFSDDSSASVSNNSDEEHSCENAAPQSPSLFRSRCSDEETKTDVKEFDANEPTTSRHCYNEERETCPECGKDILISEIVSHMDYHLALKLTEEEEKTRSVPLAVVVNKPIEKNVPANKSKKRAKRTSKEPIRNMSVTTFFKSGEPVTGDTEVCPECNKNIEANNFFNHMDYHAAKRLHLEINPMKRVTADKPVNNTNNSKTPFPNITSYFTNT